MLELKWKNTTQINAEVWNLCIASINATELMFILQWSIAQTQPLITSLTDLQLLFRFRLDHFTFLCN